MPGELIRLGLGGLGTVGTGLAKILAANADWIERRLGRRVVIKTALVRDPEKVRDMPQNPFSPSPVQLTTNIRDLLGDPDLDIIVELMGGKDTAYELITTSLRAGRHVVTANKALLAERGNELFALAAEHGVGLGYEASIAGGIPIVQTLKEGLAGNRISVLTGILNGTANFILSEMTTRGLDFQTALRQAQVKGYAEADPTLDIEGMDAAHKLILLIRLAHGQDYPLSSLPVTGITHVEPQDIAFAEEFDYRIKLIAQVRETDGLLDAGVFTALVRREAILGKVDGPFNAVLLDGDAVGPIMLYGQGAGDLPTGSAVLADIMTLVRNGRAPDNTGFQNVSLPPARILAPEMVRSRHYFRFSVHDRPGVLASIAGVLGERNISIAQVVQKGSPDGRSVPVVFVTHKALARDVQAAIQEIDQQSFIAAPTVHHRILSSPA
ncbi:MAG: homoserine dehydrogenase [Desulfovibrionales bacterium]|nr:MAG: homoserine dehydrogenase [Desulfovibrionales bacterium]